MIAIQHDDYDRLATHLSSKKKTNMHRRTTRIVSGVRTLKFFNILKLVDRNHIIGHIFGPGIDFEYKIVREASGGVFYLTRVAGARTTAIEVLGKEPVQILKRILSDSGDTPFSNYMFGEYYVRRHAGGHRGPALDEALASGQIPQTAVQNILDWNFTVIKGKKKRKPKQV